jgi:hypothetical protein
MSKELKSGVRLYAILAREARRAVIFRRGPSKRVLLILWHTDTDEFVEGQWLKGRIYERRCDLSPSGEQLIYFAADYKKPYFSWTAISHPPYLTAMALWPKGDCWGGGGLFARENEIHLNHRAGEMKLAEGFELPKQMKVRPLDEYSGRGEDSPIADVRLIRDGWRQVQSSKYIEHELGSPVWIEFNPPEVWAKQHPVAVGKYELREETHGMHERDGSWYITEHLIIDKESGEEIRLGRMDWADWCHSGDLVFAKEGKLFRLGFDSRVLLPLTEARLLIDLKERTFRQLKAPEKYSSGVI